MKGAFRSVQTPSAPFEEVISTFGGFLMKAEQPVRGGAVLAGALAVEGRDGVLLWRAFSHPGSSPTRRGTSP